MTNNWDAIPDRDRIQAELDAANALAHGRAEAVEDLCVVTNHLRSTLLALVDDLPSLLAAVPDTATGPVDCPDCCALPMSWPRSSGCAAATPPTAGRSGGPTRPTTP